MFSTISWSEIYIEKMRKYERMGGAEIPGTKWKKGTAGWGSLYLSVHIILDLKIS